MNNILTPEGLDSCMCFTVKRLTMIINSDNECDKSDFLPTQLNAKHITHSH